MDVDLAKIRALVARSYVVGIQRQYGDPGIAALRVLAPALDELHEHLAYELLAQGLTALTALDRSDRLLPEQRTISVRPEQLPGLVRGAATVQVLHDGAMLLAPEAMDPIQFSDSAVVYHFNGADHFAIAGELIPVVNPTSYPSIWGIPTFFDLQSALEHYRDQIALRCRCDHLIGAWHDPDRRWLLRNRPESAFQASLHRYLIPSLRGHQRIEVRREQPAGGRKPPDIKVTWSLTNRLAYIEVKWMGASIHNTEARISWEPGEVEANRGAEQLVGYLEENLGEAPTHQTMGFLVVFDGRRDGVAYDSEDLTIAQALGYLAREVTYEPNYSELRHDFAEPLRFFMYPKQPVA